MTQQRSARWALTSLASLAAAGPATPAAGLALLRQHHASAAMQVNYLIQCWGYDAAAAQAAV